MLGACQGNLSRFVFAGKIAPVIQPDAKRQRQRSERPISRYHNGIGVKAGIRCAVQLPGKAGGGPAVHQAAAQVDESITNAQVFGHAGKVAGPHAEEHHADGPQNKHHNPLAPQHTGRGAALFGFAKAAVQQLFAHAVNRLQQTPDDEWRGAAVPEAGSKEHAEHAQLGGQAAKAAKICPGQRHKEIILQPGRKRDVPAAPEAGKVGGVKRGLKVFRQVQPQHKAGGTGNLGIAGKAEIQIKSVHHRGQNQHGGAVIRIVGENRIHHHVQHIRHGNVFEQPQRI